MQTLPSLVNVNRLVHDPARLTILTILALEASTDFVSLRRMTGVSKGNLSNHLAKLADAGLVQLDRRMAGKQPATIVTLTSLGRAALEEHWQQLDAARRRMQFEIAHRFLDAPEGSDERALAGATLSAALAAEQGMPLVSRGGAAAAVFARLRQQAQHKPR